MRFLRLVVLGALLGFGPGLHAAMAASAKETSLRDRQQAACYDDAQRLCGQFMPDVDQVEACMRPKGAEVSPRCAAFYAKSK